jgi:hypothetical protein
MQTLKDVLLTAPESQLDPSMVELVRQWSTPPRAIQVLEVLDFCVQGGLASRVVMLALDFELEDALGREAMTREELVKYALWRSPDHGEP